MDDVAIARAIHVVAVVVWLGGVSMVTSVILPLAARSPDPAALIDAAERRFAGQARIAVLLVGASGAYMASRFDLWPRFAEFEYWWMGAMAGIWLVFALVLFVAEPLFLNRWFAARVRRDPVGTIVLMRRAHWLLLAASLATVFAAVAGSHGLAFF